MATKTKALSKRERLANILVEDRGISLRKAMIKAGFSPATAKNPAQTVKTKGFQQIAEEVGLTDNFLLTALYEDIKAKPRKRTKEIELALKAKQRLKEISGGDTTNNYTTFIQQNNLNPNAPEAKELVDMTLETLMAKTKRQNGQRNDASPSTHPKSSDVGFGQPANK